MKNTLKLHTVMNAIYNDNRIQLNIIVQKPHIKVDSWSSLTKIISTGTCTGSTKQAQSLY